MPRGIVYVTDGEAVPQDLATLDDGDPFAVTAVPGTDRGVTVPLPEDTACVVIDHDPPGVDGLATTAWVRDRYADLPVLLYPTTSNEALAATAANVGVDAYVPPNEHGNVDALRSQLRRLTERTGPITNDDTGPSTGDDTVDADGRDGAIDDSAVDVATMFESILTSLPRWVTIYVKDRQGRHVAVSGPEVAFDEETVILTDDGKMLHSREDVVGKTDFDLYAREHAEQTRKQEQRIMRTEEPDVDVTEVVGEPNGETAYYSTTKAPWYDGAGNVAGVVGITVDISDRVERKQTLERQNKRLDRFAGVLSHDIRNPLAVASGQVELLEELDLPESADDSLEDVEWSLDRIEDLIEDTLALAREGAVVDDPEPTGLESVARSAWRAMEACRGTLAVEGDPATVLAASGRLQRLFENLFSNALEHGTDDVAVSVGTLEDGHGFYVADDGPGISAEQRERVFEHGFTTREDGTGFGLAIVAEIAAAHDWTPTATESEAGGARFEFHDVAFADDET